ncbi:methyl-accepting chemotaxis protein [Desulfuribacillus alkaliarsenatis]|uniref:Methyl-accepting transducer domain-containing protein n=1 Tax=Desulfuribacillus alkaliarsenatis TaxID=766136 RepID=A0A1E5G3W4_9FIRM|nr:methyl-accepting chemotaxis protein [Desulfuribacillus alkaliarsenatis]OEF97682.1 hypothetical protein BHF68_14365 [Desulfuribacillus alkaliarsenatis]
MNLDKKLKLNLKLQVLVVAAILVSMTALQIISAFRTSGFTDEIAVNTLHDKITAYNFIIEQELEQFEQVIDDIGVYNPAIVRAFEQNRRSSVSHELDAIFANLSRQLGITSLRMYDLDLTAFYRADAPNRYGDDVSSDLLLQQVTSTQTTISTYDITEEGVAIRVAGIFSDQYRNPIAIIEVGREIPAKDMQAMQAGFGVDFTIFLRDQVLISSKSDGSLPTASQLQQRNVSEQVLNKGEMWQGRLASSGEDFFYTIMPVFGPDNSVIGMISSSTSAEPFDRQNRTDLLIGVAFQIIVQVVFFFVFYPIINYKISPIASMTNVIASIANYDYKERVPDKFFKHADEIGSMATAIEQMQNNTKDLIMQLQDNSSIVAGSSDELLQLSEATLNSLKLMEEKIHSIQEVSETQTHIAKDSSRAMEEMASGIGQVAETAASVTEESANMRINADQGKVVVSNAVQQMNEIQASAKNIADTIDQLVEGLDKINVFVSTINDISEQTNLLALNASIEAARAGEHGRGFAVVAEEVRKLAESSAQSTREINAIVQEIKSITNDTVKTIGDNQKETIAGINSVKEVDSIFISILNSIGSVAEKIESLSAVSEQMSAGAQEVSASVNEVSTISTQANEDTHEIANQIQEQVNAIEQINKSSEHLSKLSHELEDMIERFKI